jgi:hypothetical protein
VAELKEDGYIVVENAISGDDLSRLQKAFDEGLEAAKPT